MPRFDPVSVLESAYSLEGLPNDWLRGILESSTPSLDCGKGIIAFVTPFEKMVRGEFDALASTFPGDPAPMMRAMNAAITPDIAQLLLGRAWTTGSLSEMLSGVARDQQAGVDAAGAPHGVADGFGLFAQDGEGGVLSVSAMSDRKVRMTPAQKDLWERLVVHIVAMARLRKRLAPPEEAVLRPDGELAHAVGTARGAREVLVSAVRAREKARGRMRREDPDHALAIWRGLVDGTWSLVDRFESDGSRFVVAYPNAPAMVDPRRLSSDERLVVQYASLGAPNKAIAYALGLPQHIVASRLARACQKLRVKRRSELAGLAFSARARAMRVGEVDVIVEPKRIASFPELTAIENEVARAVAEGASNAEIAQRRGTSQRTIANQLATIFRKLGVGSRTELAKRVAAAA